eukprot:c3585_g1_i1.p1 GENE.c3585_g1_i1~~c3585_g1_i1.p1  ORF type:complete len:446 (+),score=84.34 c3585_g1_i1:66-1340(+)
MNDTRHTSNNVSCVMFRRTGDCRANGPREPAGDTSCMEVIENSASGYCECSEDIHLPYSCGHPDVICEDSCDEYWKTGKMPSACNVWKQTKDCSGEAAEDPGHESRCHDWIHSYRSGYCECISGRFAFNCGHRSFTCNDICDDKEFASRCTPTPTPQPFKVRQGLEYASKSSIFIVGLYGGASAREHPAQLTGNLERISTIGSKFGSHRMFLVIDEHYQELHEWKLQDPERRIVHIAGDLSYSHNPDSYGNQRIASERFQKMSGLRNIYMRNIEQEELMLVVDLDVFWFDAMSVFLTLGDNSIPDWGGVCAFGKFRGGYFDTLATRMEYSWKGEVSHSYLRCEGHFVGEELWPCRGAMQNLLFDDTRTEHIVAADSCFGGSALYRTQYIRDCRYAGYESEVRSCWGFQKNHYFFCNCQNIILGL